MTNPTSHAPVPPAPSPSPARAPDPATPTTTNPSRSRLIDYFKRLFAIVAGLAITEAVRRFFTFTPPDIPWPTVWMFLTFLITIIPIFHGGDRSLDVKYLDQSQNTLLEKFSYIWDTYMLVITGILFVCIAETLPRTDVNNLTQFRSQEVSNFYLLISFTLSFDAFVLIVDWIKTPKIKKQSLSSYGTWITVNFTLGIICYIAGMATMGDANLTASTLLPTPVGTISLLTLTILVFVAAVVRTVADYWAGRDFLFP